MGWALVLPYNLNDGPQKNLGAEPQNNFAHKEKLGAVPQRKAWGCAIEKSLGLCHKEKLGVGPQRKAWGCATDKGLGLGLGLGLRLCLVLCLQGKHLIRLPRV